MVNLHTYILAVLPAALAANIYVSPGGNIQAAVDSARSGDTVYLRAGTHRPSRNIQFRTRCSSSSPCTIAAESGAQVIVDGDNMPYTPAPLGSSIPGNDRGIFHVEDAAYWRFIGITLTKGPYGVYVRNSNNCYFERLTTHNNYETGFHMQNSVSNNQIIYLDTYRNADPRNNGQNADGIAIKEGSGSGNIIRGIRSYENADDGIDLYEFTSSVTIQDNIVFDNGINRWNFNPYRGDGIGIKLGGGSPENRRPVNHIVRNNFSFRNRRGFSDNNMPGQMTLTQNTAWKNREEGFNQRSADATYQNNLAANNRDTSSLDRQNELRTRISQSGNNWQDGGSFRDGDFITASTSLVLGNRQSNGRIVPSDFLRPANGRNYGATTRWN